MSESIETKVALLVQHMEQMEAHIEATDADMAMLRAERNQALKWGVITLGGWVIAMAGWIFAQFSGGHIK